MVFYIDRYALTILQEPGTELNFPIQITDIKKPTVGNTYKNIQV